MSNKKCVNVMLSKCFWCGEDKNELLVGKKLIDCNVDTPREMIVNYDPCDKCKEQWDKGFVIIEVNEEPNAKGQPEIQEGLYPTGKMWVVEKNTAVEIFGEEDTSRGRIFIDKAIAEKLGLYQAEDE